MPVQYFKILILNKKANHDIDDRSSSEGKIVLNKSCLKTS